MSLGPEHQKVATAVLIFKQRPMGEPGNYKSASLASKLDSLVEVITKGSIDRQ